ncbi:uncharacterized protein N7518_002861 [Penicillium psychrosexuale]|uniref:uncharacterized protein n=1 Tax=Penicillium psychrosexuale TaxID=1002107 RepID=UPI0025452043|nr:uncharacterized protein N7518_002861 [Penicillium psychrosexuale]KAJ5800793.1 hypothetical protein N7518_002861 [Penicillium psychrosexuale]
MANDTSCQAEEPGHHTVGAPLRILAGQAGDADIAPDAWARFATMIPWQVARNGRHIKTKAIALLINAVPAREPLQRSITRERLDERIGSKAAKFESVLIQIVGEIPDRNAHTARETMGPEQNALDTPRGHQRGRSSRSSISPLKLRLNITTQKADAGIALIKRMEQAVRKLQAEIAIDDRNAAIHEAIHADNYTELIVPARALIPATTPEQRTRQFDDILGMIANLKELYSTIQGI